MDDFEKLFEYAIVDREKWVKSLQEHEIGDPEITSMMFETIEEWEKKLPSFKKVLKAQIIEILSYEKDLLQKEIDDLENQKERIVATGDVFEYLIIINSKVSDAVYVKYQVENEDIMAYSKDNEDDKEVKYKEEAILELSQELIKRFGEILAEELEKS